jgi:DNA-binding GntR family transcriptional regulator
MPATDAVARILGIDEGSPVIALERLRYADDEPLALMRNWIPPGQVELTTELLEQMGLYQLMRAAGLRLHLASQTIGARAATPAEARRLQATKGEPLLTMQRTTYDDMGRPVELGDHLYRAALYSFEVVLTTRA